MNKSTLWLLLLIVLAGLGLSWLAKRPASGPEGSTVAVRLPAQFSPAAQIGQALFRENCSTCHGKNAAGSANGPPLVHKIYRPAHHADFTFHAAVKSGVVAHHWQFGNMPPVAGIDEKQVATIVRYVRELQRANGIF